MKKKKFVYIILVGISILTLACGSGEILIDPQSPGANSGEVEVSMANMYDDPALSGLKPVREVVFYEGNIIVSAFKEPESLDDTLLIFAATTQVAASDGLQFGPNDVVAIIMAGGAIYYICLYTVPMAIDALGTISAEDFRQIMQGNVYVMAMVENLYLSHSNKEHNPNIFGTKARADIEAFLAAMSVYLAGNGQDPRNKCGVTFDGEGNPIRAAIWVADAARTTGGYLMWYFINTPGTPMKGPWGGSYDITEENFDKDRTAQRERDLGWTWSVGVDCDSLGTPSFLQAAQP